MRDMFWLTKEQLERFPHVFAKSHFKRLVDDRGVLSGIIFINRNGCRWRDLSREYVPPVTHIACGTDGATWGASPGWWWGEPPEAAK